MYFGVVIPDFGHAVTCCRFLYTGLKGQPARKRKPKREVSLRSGLEVGTIGCIS